MFHFFQKKGDSWYLNNGEIISIVNLQKSNYGNQFYVNLAFWINEIEESEYPKPYNSHIVIRLTSLFQERKEYFEEVFDLENPDYSDLERSVEIENIVTSQLIPLLNKAHTIAELKQLLKKGYFKNGMIMAIVEELIAR